MRSRRQALSAAEIADHSGRIAHFLWHLPLLARCRRIACYLAAGGEVDCAPIMQEAIARGREVYLPVVHGPALVFARWLPHEPLVANRFGIPEPATSRSLRASALDVVITPLVAFDRQGRRLGMGGGFYDRSLAFTRQRGLWRKPHIIGVGYDFQRIDALPIRHWDIALHMAITESGVDSFRC